jgi:phage baseplate assembly protein W
MINFSEDEVVRGSIPSNEILSSIKRKDINRRYGLQFPFLRNQKGYFSKMADTEVVKSNLRQLIMTEPGERLMLPNFGCPLKSLLFMPLDNEVITEMRERIFYSIDTYLPTVKVLSLRVVPLDELAGNGLPTIQITLICKIRDSLDSTFNVSVTI